jgi:hypothetical protein
LILTTNDFFICIHSATKWLLRQDAIKAMTSFVESGTYHTTPAEASEFTSSILIVVKENTRSFKETNVNVMKAIIQLVDAVCVYHEAAEVVIDKWIVIDAVDMAIQKLSDKKLLDACKSLLSSACTVCHPHVVLQSSVAVLSKVKSPIIHEEYLKWFNTFCQDFGAMTLGTGLSDIVPWLLEVSSFCRFLRDIFLAISHHDNIKESKSSTIKTKREAIACFGTIHKQLGPTFKALTLTLATSQDLHNMLEECFNANPYDASYRNHDWKSQCIALRSANGNVESTLVLEVPKTDLFAILPDDCLTNMVRCLLFGAPFLCINLQHIIFLTLNHNRLRKRGRHRGRIESMPWKIPRPL